jgi:FHA domain
VATCPSGHESASDDFCDVCGYLIGAAPSLAPGQAPDAGAGPVAGPPAAGSAAAGATVAGPAPWPAEACPRCGAARDGQFCESCGHNFAAAAPGAGPPVLAVPGPQVSGAQVSGAQVSGAQVADPQATVDPWPAVSAPAGPVPGGPGPAAPGPAAPWPDAPGRGAPVAGAQWTAVVSADRAYYDSVQEEGGPDAASIEFPAYCPQRRFPLDRAEVKIGRRSASSGIAPEIDLSVPPADPGVSRLHAVLLRAADGSWAIVDPGSANGTLLNGTELAVGQVVPVRDGDRVHLGAWTELRLTCGP